METITIKEYRDTILNELPQELKETKYLTQNRKVKSIELAYQLIIKKIANCLSKTFENVHNDDDLEFIEYDDNQIGYYLIFDDRQTNKITGGNGYTGYEYASYEMTIKNEIDNQLRDYLFPVFKKYQYTDDEDNYNDIEAMFISEIEYSLELFKELSPDYFKGYNKELELLFNKQEINQLNTELAELLLNNQELKQMNDELECNNSDLNDFIKSKGLEAEYIEFIESL